MTAASRHPNTGESSVVDGAGGVVFNDEGKILLIKHINGTWVFANGHVDPGETPLEAALREVEEEAGVYCHCPDPERTFTTSYVNAHGVPRNITWFLLKTDAKEPEMREKLFPEGAFLGAEDALGRLSFPEDNKLLERVLESSG